MVWQRSANSPRDRRACRFDSCPFRQLWTCSSVESERDSAKVEVVRSNRTRSTIELIVGVALCGHPFVMSTRRAATEGRPYSCTSKIKFIF